MRTIPYTIGMFGLLREIWYTVAQMREEPLAAPYLPTFEAIYGEAKSNLLPAELGVIENIEVAQVKVDRADGSLDGYAGRVSRSVDEVGDPKTKKQLRINLFKGLPLSKFRRPVLGGQLLAQTGWGKALADSKVPSLIALAPEADPLVKKGEDASKARTDAHQANRQFRDVGARKQFIDKLNGLRRETDGALSKLAHDDPTLPNDYADRFWRTEPASEEEETIDDVKAEIAALETRTAELNKKVTQMEADAAAAAEIEAQRKANADARAALLAKREELDKQIAALDAELNK